MKNRFLPIAMSAALAFSSTAAVYSPVLCTTMTAVAADEKISEDVTLEKDTTYSSSLIVEKGTLDLNGHKLTVKGDLTVKAGNLSVTNGTLVVEGNFYQGVFLEKNAPKVFIKEKSTMTVKGNYRHYGGLLDVEGTLNISGGYYQSKDGRGEATSGVLEMDNNNSLIDVDGDVYFHSKETASYQCRGLLRVGGNFTATADGSCFQSWEENTVEFKGDNVVHTINFESASVNYFNRVKAEKGSKLLLKGATTGFVFDSDITFEKESQLSGTKKLNLNGHNLTVDGNLYQGVFLGEDAPEIEIPAESTMTVKGDLRHYGGLLDVEGTLYVNGGYLQAAKGRGEATSGVLEMDADTSLMDVDGDVYFHSKETASYQCRGLLRVGGNFTATADGSCFQSWEENTVEFKGADVVHEVSFESASVNYFNKVKAEKGSKLLLKGATTGFVFDSDITFEDESQLSGTRKLALNAHNLTVDGNLHQGVFLGEDSPEIEIPAESSMTVKGDLRHYGGLLDVEGTLNVNGGYYQAKDGRGEATSAVLEMDADDCIMDVDGDVYFHSKETASYQCRGLLRVGGNFTATADGSCFQSWEENTVEFKGADVVHEVDFESSSVNYFNKVKAEEGSKLLLKGSTTGFIFDSDITFEEESRLSGTRKLNLNAHNLTVDGNLYQGVFLEEDAPEIEIPAESSMTVKGDLRHYGGLLDVEGTLNVNGSYLQTADGRGEATSGILEMDADTSLMDVDGDVYFHSTETASYQCRGLIRVGGNFTATADGSCFQSWEENTVEFKGADVVHEVSFENYKVNYFNRVKAENGSKLLLKGQTTGFIMDSDIVLEDGSKLTGTRATDLNGHNLTVDGSFWQGFLVEGESPKIFIPADSTMTVNGIYSHDAGLLDVNGTLIIKKYYSQRDSNGNPTHGVLEMNEKTSLVDVAENVVFASAETASYQSNGVLRIGGDLYAREDGASFQSWDNHITEFYGQKEHEVKFHSADVNYFNIIKLGMGDTLNFTGALSGVDAKGAEITVTPENIAIVDGMTVKGAEEGEGEIKFANEKASAKKKLIVEKTTAVVEKPAKGDTNGDGIINAVDASKVLIMYTEISAGGEITDSQVFEVCDINKDGKINAVDASLILAYYANLAADPDLTFDAFLKSINIKVD